MLAAAIQMEPVVGDMAEPTACGAAGERGGGGRGGPDGPAVARSACGVMPTRSSFGNNWRCRKQGEGVSRSRQPQQEPRHSGRRFDAAPHATRTSTGSPDNGRRARPCRPNVLWRQLWPSRGPITRAPASRIESACGVVGAQVSANKSGSHAQCHPQRSMRQPRTWVPASVYESIQW